MARKSYENNFDISFSVTMILPLSPEMDLGMILMTNTKYIVFLTFADLDRNSIVHPRSINCYGKSNEKRMP